MKYTFQFDYQVVRLDELSDEYQVLIRKARQAIRQSHSPYSNFTVGCALLLDNGEICTGTNQENASFSVSVCAERTALSTAWNKGYRGHISAVAVTGKKRNAEPGKEPITPCGVCRQVLKEEQDIGGKPITFLMDCFDNDKILVIESVDNLLPFGFGPGSMK